MESHLESKGIDFNKDTLRSRIKNKKSIAELERNQDLKAKRMLDISDDDSSGDEEMEDVNTKNEKGERRGRKRQRSVSEDEDDYMEIDQVAGREASVSKKSDKGKQRALTPAQLRVRSKSKIRSMSKGRREGSVPQRNPNKMETEESIRLAKKINKRFKHSVNVNEADRTISVKKPKHLYAGKTSNGTRQRR